MKIFFYGLLAYCLVFGFQSACGVVLCVGADGQVSVEMTCGALAFPQQHCSASFPLRSDVLSDQDGNSSCEQCAVDIPIPGLADGVRLTPSDPSLLLPLAYYLPALFSNDFGHDEYKAANCCIAPSIPDHSISLLRTTVFLI